MKRAVGAAYGWDDPDLGHGFHETPERLRYTISQGLRWEGLDRPLTLSDKRHEEELKAGLHGKEKGGERKRMAVAKEQGTLFEL